MQALTIAIGPAGLTYFTRQFVAGTLTSALSALKPPDRQIPAPNCGYTNVGGWYDFSNISISLSGGKLTGFSPAYQNQTQEPGGKFKVAMLASNFTAQYAWCETYHMTYATYGQSGSSDEKVNFTYSPQIGSLTTTVDLAIVYNQGTQSYDITVLQSGAQTANNTANIPANSVVQYEDGSCFSPHVSDATAAAISAIDFSSSIKAILNPLLRSIPASGQLTKDIRYEFAVGDAGIAYPGDKGIAVGVTGRVSYQGNYYPAPPPQPPPPVPPVPAGDYHLQAYVSDYEINALHWAFFQAGLLNTTVQPSDLPDPDVLKVKTYVSLIPAFKPYASFAMTAGITPRQPPLSAFQQVYEFTADAMQALRQQLPANVYQLVTGLAGNAYLTVQDLQADLAAAGVGQAYYQVIEDATKAMGMVVTQDLEFVLTIDNGAVTKPNLVFDVSRTDILQKLGLGETGQAQTLTYSFMPVKSQATFVSTTVPNFDKNTFGDIIWPVAGEPRYDDTLQKMGQTGVPIPIMSGFHFLFQQAAVSIQQGYVSILAQVAVNRTAFMSNPARLGRADGGAIRPVWQGFRVLAAAPGS
jgi:hypothetical protein